MTEDPTYERNKQGDVVQVPPTGLFIKNTPPVRWSCFREG